MWTSQILRLYGCACFVSRSSRHNHVSSAVTSCSQKYYCEGGENAANVIYRFWLAFKHFDTYLDDSFCIQIYSGIRNLDEYSILFGSSIDHENIFLLKKKTTNWNEKKPWPKQKLFCWLCFMNFLTPVYFNNGRSIFHQQWPSCLRKNITRWMKTLPKWRCPLDVISGQHSNNLAATWLAASA